MILISGVGLARVDHPLGQLVLIIGSLLALYWWRIYRRLPQ